MHDFTWARFGLSGKRAVSQKVCVCVWHAGGRKATRACEHACFRGFERMRFICRSLTRLVFAVLSFDSGKSFRSFSMQLEV